MTTEEWTKKYVPTPARTHYPKISLLDLMIISTKHSLRKWIGYRTLCKVERRHELNASTHDCSLCFHFRESTFTAGCGKCPLYLTRNKTTCQDTLFTKDRFGYLRAEEDRSPWTSWIKHKDPEPMIQELKTTLKTLVRIKLKLPVEPAFGEHLVSYLEDYE